VEVEGVDAITTNDRQERSGLLSRLPTSGEGERNDSLASPFSDTERQRPVLPPAPESLAETGLSPSFLIEHLLKILHYAETATVSHLARVIGLPRKLVDELLDDLKRNRLCVAVTPSNDLSNPAYRLSETGTLRAERALERCRYAGPAPVTPDQYQRTIGPQSLRKLRPSAEVIRGAWQSLVLDAKTADLLERALHSGRCTMLFGPSGTGKTHVLSQFMHYLGGEVLVPHAIYAYGQIIRVYDRMVHVPADGGDPLHFSNEKSASQAEVFAYDRRWMRIRRPGLIVGGELRSESLELGYDPLTQFYQAPIQLKAQGGVLVVDDLGRQKVRPADLLNRWIMAFERGRDNLLLRTGENVEIPFHVTLLFSTNMNPADLADAAFLRRIPYKVRMPWTTPSQFEEILRRVSDEYQIQYSDADVNQVVSFLVRTFENQLSGSLARDLVSLLVDNAEHEGRMPTLTVAAIDLASLQFTGDIVVKVDSQ